MGRPPKPTVLKEVTGNPGRRPLPKGEPKPDATMPSCPTWLGREGKAEWRRLAGELHRIGLLTRVDRAALAAYCQAWDDFYHSTKDIAARGLVVDTGRGHVRNPSTLVKANAVQQLLAGASQFGLTPVARARMGAFIGAAPKDGQSPDELEEFLKDA